MHGFLGTKGDALATLGPTSIQSLKKSSLYKEDADHLDRNFREQIGSYVEAAMPPFSNECFAISRCRTWFAERKMRDIMWGMSVL